MSMPMPTSMPSTVEHSFVVKHTFIVVQGVEVEDGEIQRKPSRRHTDRGPLRIADIVASTSGDDYNSETRRASFCSVNSDDIPWAPCSNMSSERSATHIFHRDSTDASIDLKPEMSWAACLSSNSALSPHSAAPWGTRLSTDSCGSSDLRATHASNNQEQGLFVPLDAKQDETRTMVMVRNIPTSLSQTDFVTELIARGYRGLFRFVYMPMNFRSDGSFGYAFVGFCSPAVALQLMKQLEVLEDEDKGWRAVWSRTQGLTAHVEFYRNSPLMHETIPAACKPALYDERGVQVPFPAPTKHISKPRIHHSTIKSMKKEKESRDAVAKVAINTSGSKHDSKSSQNHAGVSKNTRSSLTINVKHEC
mmetsp:Transcript_77635/g.122568  ORF Transcript_77635/g.122568 Transcript_77635/m.122568 type:complete len:363 (+) Transcript_77635:37-1125(+)